MECRCRWLRSPTHAVARPCIAPWRSQPNAARDDGWHQPASVAPAVGAQTYAGVSSTPGSARFCIWSGTARRACCRRWCEAAAAPPTRRRVLPESRAGADLAFAFGECSCPVGINCKHVVAAAVTATGARHRPRTAAAAGRAQPAPSWEQSLRALLTPARPASHQPADAVPLAIELSLSVPPVRPQRSATERRRSPQLLARLVRPGRTGWVGNEMSWSRLGIAPTTSATAAPRTCSCCGSSTRCTPRAPERRATTPPATTRRSISPRSTASGCGRCWTRPPTSACSSCTPANGSGRSSGTARRSCAWTSAREQIPAR